MQQVTTPTLALVLMASPWMQGAAQLSSQFSNPANSLFCDAQGGYTTVGFRKAGPGLPDDMVIACHGPGGAMSVLSGFADGAYASMESWTVLSSIACYQPPSLAIGDLDADGDEDIVSFWNVNHYLDPAQLTVLWRDGGTFTSQAAGQSIELDFFDDALSAGVSLFDVNDDGLLDIVIDGQWRWLPNPIISGAYDVTLVQTTDHQFTQYTPTMPQDHYFAHHDMDGDGKEDLLYRDFGALEHYRNLGSDQFSLEASYASLAEPGPGQWHDVDQDGITDIVYGASSYLDTTRIRASLLSGGLLQSGSFLFTLPIASNGGFARDLDNDGHLDLVLRTHHGLDSSVVHLGSGNGNWNANPALYALPALEHDQVLVAPHDVDADGDLDLLTEDFGCVHWIENHFGEVGVDEPNTMEEVIFYPNPAREFMELSAVGSHGTVRIVDPSGRAVYRAPFVDQARIDLSDLADGFYLCSLVDDRGRQWHVRFIKQ